MTPQQMFIVAIVCWTLGVFIPGLTGLPARADTRPVSAKVDVNRLPAAAAALYRDTTLFPRPVKYQQIPWFLDLDAAIRQANKEKWPVLIWTSGDDPLERC
jgi:hypothetical protein